MIYKLKLTKYIHTSSEFNYAIEDIEGLKYGVDILANGK
jgi:hypothetical protein